MDVSAHASAAITALVDFKQAVNAGSGSSILGKDEWLRNLSHCETLEGRARLSVASYRLETRSLVGDQLHEHKVQMEKLQKDLDAYHCQLDWMRSDHAASRASGAGDANEWVTCDTSGPMTLDQAVLMAARTQDASAAALLHTQRTALEAEQVGISILSKINEQDEQMGRIHNEVEDIKSGVSTSKTLLRKIKWGALGFFVPRDRSSKSRRVQPRPLEVDPVTQQSAVSKSREPKVKDEFLHTKARIHELLQMVRIGTADYQELMASKGTCAESVKKCNEVRRHVHELGTLLPHLRDVQKKTRGSWMPGAVSREELQSRYEDIRVLKRQVDDAQEVFAAGVPTLGRAASPSGSSAVHLETQLSCSSQPSSEERSMTRDEKEALGIMRQRDMVLDTHLDEIRDTVVRLGVISDHIGVASKVQKQKAESLATEVAGADLDIARLNKDIGRLLKK